MILRDIGRLVDNVDKLEKSDMELIIWLLLVIKLVIEILHCDVCGKEGLLSLIVTKIEMLDKMVMLIRVNGLNWRWNLRYWTMLYDTILCLYLNSVKQDEKG